MEKVKTFLADISDLLNEKNYQKIYEKVPAFRQEKADRLKHRYRRDTRYRKMQGSPLIYHILGNMFCAAQAYPERG